MEYRSICLHHLWFLTSVSYINSFQVFLGSWGRFIVRHFILFDAMLNGITSLISHSTFCYSVQFSRSVVSDSLRPHELQHTRPPCHHQLPEFTQTHVHWDSDAIQPSHPLSSPTPAPNPSQHQSLFQWVSSSHQVANVLEFQLQHQPFQWTLRTHLL